MVYFWLSEACTAIIPTITHSVRSSISGIDCIMNPAVIGSLVAFVMHFFFFADGSCMVYLYGVPVRSHRQLATSTASLPPGQAVSLGSQPTSCRLLCKRGGNKPSKTELANSPSEQGLKRHRQSQNTASAPRHLYRHPFASPQRHPRPLPVQEAPSLSPSPHCDLPCVATDAVPGWLVHSPPTYEWKPIRWAVYTFRISLPISPAPKGKVLLTHEPLRSTAGMG
jgi:hypothetical protein